MNTQQIDRYIKEPKQPKDYFTPWVEKVYKAFSKSFWNRVYSDESDWKQENGTFEDSELENSWLRELFKNRRRSSHIFAARMIELWHIKRFGS